MRPGCRDGDSRTVGERLRQAKNLHSPLDWAFSPLQLLLGPFGPTFVKLLSLAIDRALEELQ